MNILNMLLKPFHNPSAHLHARFACPSLSLNFLVLIASLVFSINIAQAQNFGGAGGGLGNGASGVGVVGGSAGSSGNFTLGYPGTSQAQIDQAIYGHSRENLRNDLDYEDYLIRRRAAFVQQMQQNDTNEQKLRSYAEQRLKALTSSKGGLTAVQQAESHDLMAWLKKDAEQRTNNLAWLKRQDQAVAGLEVDQDVSTKNQRNAIQNMFEDNLAVQAQYKFNQQMQLASLHQYQENNFDLYASHQPFANYGGSLGGYGNSYNSGYGYAVNRWGR